VCVPARRAGVVYQTWQKHTSGSLSPDPVCRYPLRDQPCHCHVLVGKAGIEPAHMMPPHHSVRQWNLHETSVMPQHAAFVRLCPPVAHALPDHRETLVAP
jgi:hypothetical protein